jgi:hypothetical protein
MTLPLKYTLKKRMIKDIRDSERNKCIEEFEKILQEEIDNEKDSIERKSKRDWSVISELTYIKDLLLKDLKVSLI